MRREVRVQNRILVSDWYRYNKKGTIPRAFSMCFSVERKGAQLCCINLRCCLHPFDRFDQGQQSRFVVNRQFSEHFAIDLNTRFVQTVHKTAIR